MTMIFEWDQYFFEYVTWMHSILYICIIHVIIYMCVCVWPNSISLSICDMIAYGKYMLSIENFKCYSYVLCHSKQVFNNVLFQIHNACLEIHNIGKQLVSRQDYNFSDKRCYYHHQNKFKSSTEIYIDGNMLCSFPKLPWKYDSTTVD